MPEQDTVRVKMPDGRMWAIPRTNLEKAKARGALLAENGGVQEFGEGLRGSMGFSPEGGVKEDIKTIGSGLKEEAAHPIESASLLAHGMSDAQQALIDKAYEEQHSPDLMTKAHGLIRGVYSALPGLGPILSGAGEEFESGHFARGAGMMTPLAIMQALETPMGTRAGVAAADLPGKAATAIGEAGTSGLREILGVPERAIERARAEHATKMAEVQLKNLQDHNTAIAEYDKAMREAEAEHQKAVSETGANNLQKESAHRLKVDQIKQDHAAKLAKDAEAYKNKVAELQRQHEREISAFNRPGEETAAGRATAAEVKRKTLTTAAPRGGPVYQRLAGMADKIAEGVPKLAQSVRTAYDARWGAWRQAMGNVEGNFTPVQAAVQEAEDSILKGSPENIAIFRNILKEGEDPLLESAAVFKGGAGIDVKDIIGSRFMSEETRSRVLRSLEEAGVSETGRMPLAETTLPIDDIRGYVTEIQKKMYGGKFPSGDIWKALEHVKKAGEAEIERTIKANNPEQLPVYNRLKSDWSQFLGDFYDPSGALGKLKNSVNSDTRINLLKGAEGARVIDAMGRYAKFNPDIQSVGRLRSLVKQLSEMPSSATAPEAPVIPPRPGTRPEPHLPPAPVPKATPEFKPPGAPKMKEPADIVPFDVPKFVEEKVTKQAERLGVAGHTLMGYWILRDIFHGQIPSPSMLAVPMVQNAVRRYLTSPKFLERITRMVETEKPAALMPPSARGRGPSKTPKPNLTGTNKIMRYEMLKKTIEDDDKALENRNLSDAERDRIERHRADFQEMLGEIQ